MKWWRAPFKQADEEAYCNTYRLVNNFLQAGFSVGRLVKLRVAKGTGLQSGDFIIGVEDSYSDSLMEDLGEEYRVNLKPLKDVNLQEISWIRQPLIGVYTGRGVSISRVMETVEALRSTGFLKISLLTGPLTQDDLRTLDVLIVGDGDSSEILRSLEQEEAALIKRFIGSGGVYIGIGAGAILLLKPVKLLQADYAEVEAWSELQTVECELLSDMVSEPSWPVFSSRRVGGGIRVNPVKGLVKTKLVRKGLLTLGYRGEVSMVHTGPVARIVNPKHVFGRIVSPSNNVEYGIPCEEARRMLNGASNIVLTEHGSGEIVLFLSHVDSWETPSTHGILGNALILGTYGGEKTVVARREPVELESLNDAAESCRMMKLIRDSMSRVVDQIDNVKPILHAHRLSDKAFQLDSLKQAICIIMIEKDVALESVEEFLEAERTCQELDRKKPALPQTMILFNSLAEWKYVVNKSRKALSPILERIMSVQEQIADLSATAVSSPEDVEGKFNLLISSMVGGKTRLGGASSSPGVVPPLCSIILNIEDSLEKTRMLRKIVTYVNP